MGFQIPRQTYRLRFDDGSDLDGAEVVTRQPSIGEYLEFVDAFDTRSDADETRAVFAAFAAWVEQWNLEDGGAPVPISADGMMSLPPTVALQLVYSWIRAVAGVDAGPFDDRADDDTVVGLPMEPLAAS